MKTCSKCKKEKPLSEFVKGKEYKDGYFCWCKSCTAEYGREWDRRNRKRNNEMAKRHYKKNRKIILARDKAWELAHPEQQKEYDRLWYLKHRERLRKEARDEFRRNPAIFRDSMWKSSGIKNPDGTPFTTVDYNKLFQMQDGKCRGCSLHVKQLRGIRNVKNKLYVDHDHVTGIVRSLLCNDCNLTLGFAKDNIQTLENLINILKVRK